MQSKSSISLSIHPAHFCTFWTGIHPGFPPPSCKTLSDCPGPPVHWNPSPWCLHGALPDLWVTSSYRRLLHAVPLHLTPTLSILLLKVSQLAVEHSALPPDGQYLPLLAPVCIWETVTLPSWFRKVLNQISFESDLLKSQCQPLITAAHHHLQPHHPSAHYRNRKTEKQVRPQVCSAHSAGTADVQQPAQLTAAPAHRATTSYWQISFHFSVTNSPQCFPNLFKLSAIENIYFQLTCWWSQKFGPWCYFRCLMNEI